MNTSILKSLIIQINHILENPSSVPGGRLSDLLKPLKYVHGDIVMDIHKEIRSVNTQKVLHGFERSTTDIVYENILSRERDKKLSTLNIK